MADEVPRRRPGRKPLDPTDPSCAVCLTLPSKQYDALYARAQTERISVPELLRRVIFRRHQPDPDRST